MFGGPVVVDGAPVPADRLASGGSVSPGSISPEQRSPTSAADFWPTGQQLPGARLPGWQQDLSILAGLGLGTLAPAAAPEVAPISIPAPPQPISRDARHRNQAEQRMICGMWSQTGTCAYGSRCQFAHDLSPTRSASGGGSSPTDEQRSASGSFEASSPAAASTGNNWPTIGEAAAMATAKTATKGPPNQPTNTELRSSPLSVGEAAPLLPCRRISSLRLAALHTP